MGKKLQESEELRICAPAGVLHQGLRETITHRSPDKIRDVMSAVLRSAVDYALPIRNPIENVRCLGIAVGDVRRALA